MNPKGFEFVCFFCFGGLLGLLDVFLVELASAYVFVCFWFFVFLVFLLNCFVLQWCKTIAPVSMYTCIAALEGFERKLGSQQKESLQRTKLYLWKGPNSLDLSFSFVSLISWLRQPLYDTNAVFMVLCVIPDLPSRVDPASQRFLATLGLWHVYSKLG